MPTPDEIALQGLLEALMFSPNNTPLRKHVVATYSNLGQWEEAEKHLLLGLQHAPQDHSLKLLLAATYLQLGKHSAVFVIVEELHSLDYSPAEVNLLHARLLLAHQEPKEALEKYQLATRQNPGLQDKELETALTQQAYPGFSELDLKVPTQAPEREIYPSLERPTIKFKDVGGMEKVKEEIEMKIIHPLQHPELYKAYGKQVGGGILMYGPPGCGKTLLARATAGQVNASFLSVGINDILDMWIGNSEKNLHQVFELARAQAPCVLFFDEVDALGASRTDMRKSGGRHLINQFLSELDGVEHSNEGVLILAATNTPWNMDSAFRRPGRFDRIVFVTPPDQAAKEAILEVLLHGKPSQKLNLEAIAKKAKDFSGADLKAIVDVAIELKLRESMKKGQPLPIEQNDLLKALDQVKPSTKEWFTTARNYALYANENGLYDEILDYMGVKK
ncbi:cell division protein [Rufibacter radiotolerans]|uniref:Cell division protein n=1 Tax=Rufibacter radiotolerans TaxID=1379910 RepID=A0A0H4VI24_9BACT|nr:ATP-binding protein [Rufibacter radiotolerans]AKQ45023.1 cell division protein [Rufibacter radiotolerans]